MSEWNSGRLATLNSHYVWRPGAGNPRRFHGFNIAAGTEISIAFGGRGRLLVHTLIKSLADFQEHTYNVFCAPDDLIIDQRISVNPVDHFV
jgi:hypothetical protein